MIITFVFLDFAVCLPFKNMISKPAPISAMPAKKRKRSSDGSLVMQKSPRVQRVEKSDDESNRKMISSKVCNTDNEVSSSSWNENTNNEKTQNYNGMKSRTSAGPLDNYLRTTQQREVSTSVQDDEAVVDLTDVDVDCAIKPDKSVKMVDNNDNCPEIVSDKVNIQEENKENVASDTTNVILPCEKNCKITSDCKKSEVKSDKVCSSVYGDEDKEACITDEKKGDKQLTDRDVPIQSNSLSQGGVPPAISADSPGECLDSTNSDALVDSSTDDEDTPKKLNIAKNSATPTSSNATDSTPFTSPCSQLVTEATTPVSSTKFKVCMFLEPLKKIY